MLLDVLSSLQKQKRDEIMGKIERLLGLVEDDDAVIEIELHGSSFDLMLTCKHCFYSVRLATLQLESSEEGWRDQIAIQSSAPLERFQGHTCINPKIVVRQRGSAKFQFQEEGDD